MSLRASELTGVFHEFWIFLKFYRGHVESLCLWRLHNFRLSGHRVRRFLPTGTKRRYVPCQGAFCADNQMGLYFCCGQNCCVWRLDRRSMYMYMIEFIMGGRGKNQVRLTPGAQLHPDLCLHSSCQQLHLNAL